MKAIRYIPVSLLCFLMACSETDLAPIENPAKEDHIMSGYMQALEKAEEVQVKIDEGIERQQKTIDAAVGNQ